MNVADALRSFTKQIKQAGVASARLDSLILLEDATGKNRAWLLAHPEHPINKNSLAILQDQVARRATHEPLAYIRGKSEFYGREFFVDHRVLEPRPESEAIIGMLLSVAPDLPERPVIADIGTGSGALAITTKLELSQLPAKTTAVVIGTDIDPSCLEVAARNAHILRAEVQLVHADLLETQTLPPHIDVILANLPYVPDTFDINLAAGHEPRTAIFGGPDGLDLYRRLFQQAQRQATPPHYIITEALPPHHGDLAYIAKEAGYSLQAVAGFVQLFSYSLPSAMPQVLS